MKFLSVIFSLCNDFLNTVQMSLLPSHNFALAGGTMFANKPQFGLPSAILLAEGEAEVAEGTTTENNAPSVANVTIAGDGAGGDKKSLFGGLIEWFANLFKSLFGGK